MPLTQENRLIALSTPLGDDKLLLASFSGHEAISRLFTFSLELLSEGDPVDFSTILGQNVTISVKEFNNTPRCFNGIVSRFSQTGKDASFTTYNMEVVPWTWLLTRYADCKIFHNKSVQEIIEQVFEDRGLTDYRMSLTGTYNPLEYCVQYRETDFNFISRLMEQNGIFYFFEHEEGKHTMVIADASSAHESCPGQDSFGYNLASGGVDDEDVINSFSLSQHLHTGKYTMTDYNFKTPSTNLLSSESTIYTVGSNSSFEFYDHPGEFLTRADGTTFAKRRMEEEEAGHLVGRGAGVCRAFTTGYKFSLTDHPDSNMDGEYILTEVEHIASAADGYRMAEGDVGSDYYSNQFTCIPSDVVFRPASQTPKPFVQGLQTAVVVGKGGDEDAADDDETGGDGEEIWVDKYGRVLVKFPWDRVSANSCWVRVSQTWAGQGWGAINIPRVGQEVLVSFLEGDPDRPIITGRVYNAEQTVPYKLPDNGTRTTFKTRSTTGGGEDNYNELRFEDKTGSEQIFVRGEKDYDTRIKNDSREWIGNNRSLMVTKDQMEKVSGDVHLQVVGKQVEKIGGDLNLALAGNQVEKISGDRNVQISGKHAEKVTGDYNCHVQGNLNEKSDETISIQAGQNIYEKSGMNFAHEAGQMIHLKGGMTVVIEAGTQLSLKVGGNFITLDPSGVSIVGTMVMINSGGAAGSGCGSSPTDPAAPTDPADPTDPDEADDGSKGTKMNG